MTMDELEYKEAVLRECFEDKLEELDVNGKVDMCTVKCIKNYGALWHYTHQLWLAKKAKEKQSTEAPTETSADTMEFKATGLKMAKGENS